MENSEGFSLAEILVVLAVVVILLLIGIPTTRMMIPSIELTSTSRQISSELRYAAQLAVTEQVNYLVKFDLVANQYSLYRLPDPEHPETEEFVELKELPDSISFQSISGLTDNEVRFNSAGAPSDSGQVVIINTSNNSKIIDIRPSGYVRTE